MNLVTLLGVQIADPATIVIIAVAVVLIAACVVLGILSKKNKKK